MKLPPIPTSLHTVLGPVPVRRVPVVIVDGKPDDDALGCANIATREIQLDDIVTSRAAGHQVARHEWVHIVLYDGGVQLPEGLEEQVCDVIATALVAEMLAK